MVHTSIIWKKETSWVDIMPNVIAYLSKPNLKFGLIKQNKIFPVISALCKHGCLKRDELKKDFGLAKDDDIATILSNVTMAIQGSGGGKVWAPENGGWYEEVGAGSALTYVVCPGFASAWNAMRA